MSVQTVQPIQSPSGYVESVLNQPGGVAGNDRVRKQMVAFTRANFTGRWDTASNPLANGTLSNGTDTASTYIYQHYCTNTTGNIRLTYGNGAWDALGPNAITVKASVQDSAGNIYPVFFGGARTVTIQPGAFATSDELGLNISKGDYVWSITYVSVASAGQKWPIGMVYQFIYEGVNTGDLTATGTAGITTTLGVGYGPAAIYGEVSNDAKCVALIGDSIFAGAGGFCYVPNFGLCYDYPWEIACMDDGVLGRKMGAGMAHVRLFKGGESAQQWLAPATRALRQRMLKGCTHAVVEYFRNDAFSLTTLAQFQSTYISLWKMLLAQGIRVHQCTALPMATSTDGWATLVNQTTDSSNAVRVLFNNWLRDGAPMVGGAGVAAGTVGALRAGATGHPLAGYIEAADCVESSRDSGLWKVGDTGDAIHPTQQGNNDLSTAFTTAIFQ